MTSTPVNLLSLRSNQNSDRPKPATLQLGQIAVNYGAADGGVYYEDTGGSVRKVGSNHYGSTAPNSAPVGQTGNSLGETWVDSSAATYYMKVWDGSAWQIVGSAFADTATTAGSAATATFASSAAVASGCISASGCIVSSGLSVTSSLPVSSPEGTLMYQAAAPSGLYIYVGGAWVQV